MRLKSLINWVRISFESSNVVENDNKLCPGQNDRGILNNFWWLILGTQCTEMSRENASQASSERQNSIPILRKCTSSQTGGLLLYPQQSTYNQIPFKKKCDTIKLTIIYCFSSVKNIDTYTFKNETALSNSRKIESYVDVILNYWSNT